MAFIAVSQNTRLWVYAIIAFLILGYILCWYVAAVLLKLDDKPDGGVVFGVDLKKSKAGVSGHSTPTSPRSRFISATYSLLILGGIAGVIMWKTGFFKDEAEKAQIHNPTIKETKPDADDPIPTGPPRTFKD